MLRVLRSEHFLTATPYTQLLRCQRVSGFLRVQCLTPVFILAQTCLVWKESFGFPTRLKPGVPAE